MPPFTPWTILLPSLPGGGTGASDFVPPASCRHLVDLGKNAAKMAAVRNGDSQCQQSPITGHGLDRFERYHWGSFAPFQGRTSVCSQRAEEEGLGATGGARPSMNSFIAGFGRTGAKAGSVFTDKMSL